MASMVPFRMRNQDSLQRVAILTARRVRRCWSSGMLVRVMGSVRAMGRRCVAVGFFFDG